VKEEQLRKIDALVAEHVTGWNPQIIIHKHPYLGTAIIDQTEVPGLCLPHYSTSIVDAWEVVETLQQRGITCHIICCASSTLYRVDFRFHSEASTVGCVTSDESVAIAICLAALKIKGVDVMEFET
jgi:hypothetical protein